MRYLITVFTLLLLLGIVVVAGGEGMFDEWDGYFYLEGEKLPCNVLSERKLIPVEERKYPEYDTELVNVEYTATPSLLLAISYPFTNKPFPRKCILIPTEEFYPTKSIYVTRKKLKELEERIEKLEENFEHHIHNTGGVGMGPVY